jgi:heterodisulfide reductase subunit B
MESMQQLPLDQPRSNTFQGLVKLAFVGISVSGKDNLGFDLSEAVEDSINAEISNKVEGKIKVSSILEVLSPRVSSGEIAGKATKKLTGLKPACYYGCLLTRFPVDVDVPDSVENPQGMEIVCKAVGAEPIDWSYKTDCCGASAAYNDAE